MPQKRISELVVMILILLTDPKAFPLLSNVVLDKHIYFYSMTLIANEHPVP